MPQTRSLEVVFYRFRVHSFNHFLDIHGLFHQLNIPATTRIDDLMNTVTDRLIAAPQAYQLHRGVSHVHEDLPLRLLSFVNRATPRRSAGQIFLQKTPFGRTETILDLIRNRRRFSPGLQAVEDGRFVIHMSKQCLSSQAFCINFYIVALWADPLLATLSIGDSPPRIHHCLSQRFYSQFRSDDDAPVPQDDDVSCCDEDDTEPNANVQRRFGPTQTLRAEDTVIVSCPYFKVLLLYRPLHDRYQQQNKSDNVESLKCRHRLLVSNPSHVQSGQLACSGPPRMHLQLPDTHSQVLPLKFSTSLLLQGATLMSVVKIYVIQLKYFRTC
jgi:hypothetical protein